MLDTLTQRGSMKIAFSDTKSFERKAFEEKNQELNLDIKFLEMKLNPETAVFAQGHEAVCAFVNDKLNAACLQACENGGLALGWI